MIGVGGGFIDFMKINKKYPVLKQGDKPAAVSTGNTAQNNGSKNTWSDYLDHPRLDWRGTGRLYWK